MNRNLTNTNGVTILCLPCNSEVGRGNLFRCGSFSMELVRAYFIMTGLFEQLSKLVAPYRGISTSFNPVANTVESVCDGYSHSRYGTTDEKIKRSTRATPSDLKQKTND